MTICVKCLVSGRVQGVFYRASARHQAQQLNIQGHAINLPDGRVEVFACGEPAAIEQFRGWLARGPSGAAVSSVACEVVADRDLRGFTTG
jgi:acylphosphatase